MTELPTSNLKITQTPEITAAGQTVRTVHVQFMLGDHGPFTMDFPSSNFTAAEVNRKISELRQQLQSIQ